MLTKEAWDGVPTQAKSASGGSERAQFGKIPSQPNEERNMKSFAFALASITFFLAMERADAQSGATLAGSIAVANCEITKVKFITYDTGPFNTASGTFVAIPGMTTAVTVGGNTPSCVLAEVSGDSFTTSREAEHVGVTIDGSLGKPSFVQFSMNDPSAAQEHAALFVFPSVAPGIHTVAMVFKSAFGGTVSISRPAMRIDHQ